MVGMTACQKDTYHYLDVLTELVEGHTDSQGQLVSVRLDDGKVYPLTKAIPFKDSTPDSTYRLRCTYLPESESATVYTASTVFSPHPVTSDYFKEGVKNDPVKVTSVWLSRTYLNMHLGIMTHHDETHKYHFIKEIASSAEGRKRVTIQLYHDQGTDLEAYTQEMFASCPLSTLPLQPGDSLYLHIHTYDGWQYYGFEYQKP